MTQRAGYLFISCPASTTPMHFDVEHSFLLQVKGVKHVSVAAFEDDPVRPQREFDRYMDGRECDFEAMQAVAETFTIEPGVGVYLPSYVPHWVETEAGISISFSIPFHTTYMERAEAVITDQQADATAAPLSAADWRRRSASTRPRRPWPDHLRGSAETTAHVTEHPDDESVLRDRLSVLGRQKWIVLLAGDRGPAVRLRGIPRSAAPVPGVRRPFSSTQQNPTAQALNLQHGRRLTTRPVRGHAGQAGSRGNRRSRWR